MEEVSKNPETVSQKEEDYCLVIEENTIYEIDRRCAKTRFRNRTDTDSCSSQIADFVNFKNGVDTSGFCQNVVDTIGRNGIQSASEGEELDHL